MKLSFLDRLSLRRAGGLLAVSSLALVPAAFAGEGTCGITGVPRVVAIGDVHASFDNLVSVLTMAGLLDRSAHWAGGKGVFVQVGDILDRGVEARPVLDLLMRLEKEARPAGGRVIVLLGNHDVMNILGDLSAVQPAEYAEWKEPETARSRTPSGQTRRMEFVDAVTERAREEAKAAGQPFDEAAYRRKILDETPLGYVERAQALSASGAYGQWLRGRDVVATVNGVAFVHGGLTPEVAALGCEEINRKVRSELGTRPGPDQGEPAGGARDRRERPAVVPRPRAGRREGLPPQRPEGGPVDGGKVGRDRPHAHRRRENPPALRGAGGDGRRGDAGGTRRPPRRPRGATRRDADRDLPDGPGDPHGLAGFGAAP